MPAHRPGGTSGVRAAVVLLAPVSSAFLACALSACGASSSDESGDADRRRLSASHAGCWVEDESDPRTGMVAGSWFDADDVGWFVGAGLTRCDGEGWSRSTARSDRTTDGPFEDAWGFTGTDLWAVGERGAAHWDGLDWEVAEATGGAFLRGIWGGQDGVMWAVGETAAYGGGGVVFRGTRDGVWSAIAIPAGGALNDVWGSAPDDVWAVGDGTMLHFDGDSWTRRDPAPPGVGGYAVWGASATDVWVAAGDVWRWRDGAWTRAAWLPEGSYRSVWGRSSDEVWVVRSCRDEGEPSVVFWDGDTWTVEVTSPSPAGWFEIDRVVGSPGGRVFGLSRPSGWVTERVGGSWKVVWPGSTQAAEAIAGTGPDDIWFASGYFAFHKGVSSWRAYRLPVSDTLVAIWAAAADDVWAAGRDNTLVHWDGSGWTATVVEDVAFFRDVWGDRKSTRLNSSHIPLSRMPSSA